MLSVKEAAERLGVSERTVQRWCKQGRIRAVEKTSRGGRKGKVFLIPEEEIKRLIGDTKEIGDKIDDIGDTEKILTTNIDDIGDIDDTTLNEDTSGSLENQGVHGEGVEGVPTSVSEVGTKVGTSEEQKLELFKLEPFVIEEGEIWLPRKVVQELLNVSYRAVLKACSQGKYKTREMTTRGGVTYFIALSSLPAEAQKKWIASQDEEVLKQISDEVKNKLSLEASIELALKTSPRREIDPKILFNKKLKSRLAKLVPALEEALHPRNLKLPFGERTKLIERLAKEVGINKQNFYRYLKLYREGGISALVPEKKKGASAWDEEAIAFLQGVYLKGLKEAGEITVRKAYSIVEAEAKKRGWKIGSERSAYQHIKAIHPLVKKYATGGRRALDNVFYLARRYDDLHPFEIIVGDQHRFDFFVQDPETGKVFRPEGYVWLDMRTRLCYGIAIAGIYEMRNYNAYLMGVALRCGLSRFGKFKCCYTDNGKPERSRYFAQVADEMRLMGLQSLDISELYKTEEGQYVVEAEEGEVVGVVDTVNAWRRYAKPRNAKAKPIERFFQTLEGIILDLGVPGHVKELGGKPEEQELADKRLKELANKGKLLTPEEALLKIFEAVEIYNTRYHQALGKSPLEELNKAVEKEGFTPVFISPEEVFELAFLVRSRRKVSRGRVKLLGREYTAEELYKLEDGTPIEVRFDLYDPAKALAVFWEKEEAVELELVRYLSMKGGEEVREALQKKAKFIRKIIEKYRELTRPVPGVVQYSKVERVALKLKRKRREKESRFEVSDAVFKEALAEAEERAKAKKQEDIIVFPRVSSALPAEPVDRYAALIDLWEDTGSVPEEEIPFMQEFETRMTEEQKKYWNFVRELKGLPQIGENLVKEVCNES